MIVVGGYGPSLYPEIITNNCIDILIKGEGEVPFKIICDNYFKKNIKNFDNIPGVITSKNNQKKDFYFVSDLDYLPYPVRKYIDGNNFAANVILTSRGCVYKCKFCAVNKFYKSCIPPWRTRNINEVVKELMFLKKRRPNIKYFEIFDDEFMINGSRVKDFFTKVSKINSLKNMRYSFAARANDIVNNKEILSEYKYLINEVFCGIESFNSDFLENLGKLYNGKQMVEYNIKAINILEKNKINFKCGFINPARPKTAEYLEEHLPIKIRDRFINWQNLIINLGKFTNHEIPYNAIEGDFAENKNNIYLRFEKVMKYYEKNIFAVISDLHKQGNNLSVYFENFFIYTMKYVKTADDKYYKLATNSFNKLLK
ncbi:radical SAM protein [Candidatus Falkowbacteria bacterium]|nr:radical SAM protein [Candidatus Falkowbacteria bacterium]